MVSKPVARGVDVAHQPAHWDRHLRYQENVCAYFWLNMEMFNGLESLACQMTDCLSQINQETYQKLLTIKS